jgi:hypothetical protein
VKIAVDYNNVMLRMRDVEYRLLYRVTEVLGLRHGHEPRFLVALAEETPERQE